MENTRNWRQCLSQLPSML